MRIEVIEKIAALITAAFGLVAALAWNDAIRQIFEAIFAERGTIIAMVIYAVVVTIIAVAATIWIGNVSDRAKARIEEKKKEEEQSKKTVTTGSSKAKKKGTSK